MIDLTGMGSVLRGMGLLYWMAAIAAVALAIWEGKDRRSKTIWALVAVAIFGFLPVTGIIKQAQRDAYKREAWAYFKKLCDEKSGEKIYKTYTGVKSVLVVRPLPPAREKDFYDQYWYGDPYSTSATSKRAESAATQLTSDRRHRNGTGIQRGLDFVEMSDESGNGYIRINRPVANNMRAVREYIKSPVSRFGVAWEDISTQQDRKYWVAGSRFRVIDLTDNSVIAERIGFLIEAGFGSTASQRRPWQTSRGIGPNGRSCPDAHDATDQWFITSVFRQEPEK